MTDMSADDAALERPILRTQNRTRAPLSTPQHRLWVADQIDPGNPAYNVASTIRLEGPLDIRALESGLAEIVARHEALRTTFDSIDGEPVQTVHPAGSFALPLVDLTDVPAHARETEARRRIDDHGRAPFNISTGPLFRFTLLKLSGEEHILAICMQHLAIDGWSNTLCLLELGRLYRSFAAGRASPLSALPIQYADYAVWQREQLGTPEFRSMVGYWVRQLAGCPVLQLPLDRPRQAGQSLEGGCEHRAVAAGAVVSLEALAKAEQASVFMVLLTAFYAVLHRYTGSDDIVVGTDVANRHPPATKRLVGFFVNQLALRVDCGADPSFRALLRRVRDVVLAGYAHQMVPFDKVVEAVRPRREPGITPVFQAMLTLDTFPFDRASWPGLTVTVREENTGTSKYDLGMFARQVGEALTLDWHYRTAVFDAATIAQMADRYQRLLDDALERPDARLSELAFLSEAERATRARESETRKASQRSRLLSARPKAVRLESPQPRSGGGPPAEG